MKKQEPSESFEPPKENRTLPDPSKAPIRFRMTSKLYQDALARRQDWERRHAPKTPQVWTPGDFEDE